MHIVWVLLALLLIAGFVRVSFRRALSLVAVTAVGAGLGSRGLFRVRRTRIVGELFLLAVMLLAAHELTFFRGKFAPEQAVHSTLHVHLPFLHWFVSTFGLALIALALVIVLGVVGYIAWSRYAAARELRIDPRPGVSRPVFVRVALFNSSIVFLKPRSATAWLRTELACFVVALLTAAAGEGSEDLADDKHFRRLLGSTAWDWSSFVALARGLRAAAYRVEDDLGMALDDGIDVLSIAGHHALPAVPIPEEGAA